MKITMNSGYCMLCFFMAGAAAIHSPIAAAGALIASGLFAIADAIKSRT